MENKEKSPVFDEIFRNYLEQMKGLDFAALARRMGAAAGDGGVAVRLFGREHLVSPDGITGPAGARAPLHAELVTLCRYFLHFPSEIPEGGSEFTSYREFRDAAPFVGGFKTNAEIPLARNFSGRLSDLKAASAALGGADPGTIPGYDLTMKFEALPLVPVVLLFNDGDDEFPANALILFERRAENFLDMECLAIIGWLLADYLYEKAGDHRTTIM